MESAFSKVKEILIEDTTLAYPDHSKDAEMMELYVDASNVAAGAILMQKQQGVYKTIGYASTTFSKAQQRYSTIEREISAIRFGVKAFKPFIFWTKFIIWSDHKPLMYLRNFANENSRLMRIVNELSEYNFIIKYKPGPENEAADALSRIPTEIAEENSELNDELPKGLKILEKVEGGGDSMFKALWLCIQEMKEDNIEFPDEASDHVSLRKIVVNHLLQNSSRFNIKINRDNNKQYRAMLQPGQLPTENVFLVAADLLDSEIWVHYGMSSPIIYRPMKSDRSVVLHIQCLAGIHYNPVIARKNTDLNQAIKTKNINTIPYENEDDESNETSFDNDDTEDNIAEINTMTVETDCTHRIVPHAGCVANFYGLKTCMLLDCGAQVNAVTESTFARILDANRQVELISDDTTCFGAVKDKGAKIRGITFLDFWIGNKYMEAMPFAVVCDEYIQTCCIMGVNTMDSYGLVLDYSLDRLCNNNGQGLETICSLNSEYSCEVEDTPHMISTIAVQSNSDEELEESSDEQMMSKVKITISQEQIVNLQSNNHAMRNLFKCVVNKMALPAWPKCLHQFKRINNKLAIFDGILTVNHKNNVVPVIPFNFLVEVLYQVHKELNHIGRNKLIELISSKFYHPAMNKVANDICTSCVQCQMFKVSRQVIKPPTLKVVANHPFDLVAVDLVRMTGTISGYDTCLVAVDNLSKFMMVVPVKDKKSITIAHALEYQILPYIVRVPNRILSDNGNEFKSHFETVLSKYNIEHVHSSSYKPSSNGLVERGNRTVLQLLKLSNSHPTTWDEELAKTVLTYNNTVHSELGVSPSQYILENIHKCNAPIPLNSNIVSTWRPGHPNFAPFKKGQQVLRKKPSIGNLASNKFSERYTGPFTIMKLQSNRVTYEMQDIEGKLYKAHHSQLKLFKQIPYYLKRCLPVNCSDNVENHGIRDEESSDSSYSGGIGFMGSDSDSERVDSVEKSEDGVTNNIDRINDNDTQSSNGSGSSGRENHTGASYLGNVHTSSSDTEQELEKSDHDKNQSSIFGTRNPSSIPYARSVPDLRVMKNINLYRLHCSEPANYHYTSINLLDSNFPGRIKHSTPVRSRGISDTIGLFEREKRELCLSPVKSVDEDVHASGNISKEIVDDFLTFVEQSLGFQCELMDNLEKEVVNAKVGENPPVNNLVVNADNFEGTGESNNNPGSARSELIKIMRSRLISTNKHVVEFKLGKNYLARKLWKRKAEESFIGGNISIELESEVYDTLSPLNVKLDQCNSPVKVTSRPHTRSRGPVKEYSHVQNRILERKLKQ